MLKEFLPNSDLKSSNGSVPRRSNLSTQGSTGGTQRPGPPASTPRAQRDVERVDRTSKSVATTASAPPVSIRPNLSQNASPRKNKLPKGFQNVRQMFQLECSSFSVVSAPIQFL